VYTNSFPNYSSSPAFDFVNPGMNVSLYSDIVPVTNHQIDSNYQMKQKVDLSPNIKIDEGVEERSDKGQAGSGMDPKIKNSFLNPRPIKTEMLQLAKNKRKLTTEDKVSAPQKPKKKLKEENFKFQFA